jgi:hypothetical protein
MGNRGVLIGSIVFVFGSFILMVSLLLYESYKANKMKALASSIKTEARPAQAVHLRWIIPCTRRR